MNARQKAKKLKKQIGTLKSDNDLMRRIIADSPAMQELYDLYNKPTFVTHTAMQFQEFRAKRTVPVYMRDLDETIERAKQAVAKDLFETEGIAPIITASIFVGRRE
jgi:hypothetical protein